MWIQTTDGTLVNSEYIALIRLEPSTAKQGAFLIARLPPTRETAKDATVLASGTDNELGALYERLKIALVHNAPFCNLGED